MREDAQDEQPGQQARGAGPEGVAGVAEAAAMGALAGRKPWLKLALPSGAEPGNAGLGPRGGEGGQRRGEDERHENSARILAQGAPPGKGAEPGIAQVWTSGEISAMHCLP